MHSAGTGRPAELQLRPQPLPPHPAERAGHQQRPVVARASSLPPNLLLFAVKSQRFYTNGTPVKTWTNMKAPLKTVPQAIALYIGQQLP